MIMISWDWALTICAGKAQVPQNACNHSGDGRSVYDTEHMPCLQGVCYTCSPFPGKPIIVLVFPEEWTTQPFGIHTKHSGYLQEKQVNAQSLVRTLCSLSFKLYVFNSNRANPQILLWQNFFLIQQEFCLNYFVAIDLIFPKFCTKVYSVS